MENSTLGCIPYSLLLYFQTLIINNAGVAQLVEHLLPKQGAEGSSPFARFECVLPMSENVSITEVLRRIDGRDPAQFSELVGHHDFKRFFLYIDLVEQRGRSFVALVRARALKGNANYPADIWNTNSKRIALEDCIARLMRKDLRANTPIQEPAPGRHNARREDAGQPQISLEAGRQEIIERTAVRVSPYWVEARLEIVLPAHGGRIRGKECNEILARDVPRIIERSMLWENMPQERVRGFIDSAACYEIIQVELEKRELLSFVADGAVLPRARVGGDLPLESDRVVPFTTPESLKVTIDLPALPKTEGEPEPRSISGMGIPKGITVILGAKGQGKSTLIRGIQQGIYPHVPGDGREKVITTHKAVKVRADEGRTVGKLDISAFVTTLPRGRDPKEFYARHATETESFVAALVESIEADAKLILIDEDLTPAELLFQDPRIARLVNSAITPLAKRLHDLWTKLGISSVVATESYGEFLQVADRVFLMQDFKLTDITAETKKICAEVTAPAWEQIAEYQAPAARVPLKPKLEGVSGPNPFQIHIDSRSELRVRNNRIDVRALEQIGERAQVQGIGYALHYILLNLIDGESTVSQIVDRFEDYINSKGLDYLSPFFSDGKHPGDFARPRREELQQVLNRLPFLRVRRGSETEHTLPVEEASNEAQVEEAALTAADEPTPTQEETTEETPAEEPSAAPGN